MLRLLEEGKSSAPGAQRQAARPRGRDRRPGRPSRRSPSPPTWPAAAPTSCWRQHREAELCRAAATRPIRTPDPRATNKAPPRKKPHDGAGRRRPAHRRHRAPRIAAASTTSCAAARPPGRPGRRVSSCRWTTLMRIFAGDRGWTMLTPEDAWARRSRPDRHPARWNARSARSRPRNFDIRKQLLSTTTSPTTSARSSTSSATKSGCRGHLRNVRCARASLRHLSDPTFAAATVEEQWTWPGSSGDARAKSGSRPAGAEGLESSSASPTERRGRAQAP